MPFHSPLFVLVFLPLVVAGFFLIGRFGRTTPALFWLLTASLAFFAAADIQHFWVLALSLAGNYGSARLLGRCPGKRLRRCILLGAVAANIALLAAFKLLLSPWLADIPAASSFVSVLGDAALVPLGLSFITFQQIGYLVDVHKQRIQPGGWLDYALFVTFFPQMVMGPIVRFRDLAPQLRSAEILRPAMANLAAGLTIFACGFCKKVAVADRLAPFVDAIFNAAASGIPLHPVDAALAGVAFQFQLYFDFSAYADMAIGIARMFNIHLPINFCHPFRAVDRFDVWRRWHLTFVAFMREYVFHPLVKDCRWPAPAAILFTGVLSGLWHGLSWNFLLWGVLTGMLLVLRHFWTLLMRRAGLDGRRRMPKGVSIALTFAVTTAMGVLFRSGSPTVAAQLFLAPLQRSSAASLLTQEAMLLLLLGAVMIWRMPNIQEVMGKHWRALDVRSRREINETADERRPRLLAYAPGLRWGVLTGLLLAAAMLGQGETTRYLYYQF